MHSKVELSELSSEKLPDPVPYAVITPPGDGPFPLCVLLMGGGGSRQSLIECQPLFAQWWAEGVLAPMVFATPSAGMSYYVEDPAGGVRWDAFITEDFIPHLRRTCNVRGDQTSITGISMGGYGALKMAFAHPEEFKLVAAMNPMIEPGYRDSEVGARNRLHHGAGGPERLIGPGRDAELVASNHPANRARANAVRIRESGLAIFLEVGDQDFVNAHDGTEFLHRVLWELDLSHEYHLVRGGDHGGPTFRPRMRAMLAGVSAVLTARTGEPSAEERALAAMRESLRAEREKASEKDATVWRRYGVLPAVR
jgi:S-formylglutathione hydrolase